jgi:hypothetical protein
VLARAVRASSVLAAVVFAAHDAPASWPPRSGADMRDPANWPNDPAYPTAWPYFSWLPSQAAGAAPYLGADAALGASGMSVDVGWTYSTGRPDVKIAVADSGIEWDEPDLVDKAWLNAAELAKTKRPEDAQGSPCGGAGVLSGYDCNGDGVFSVADYRDDPRLAPVVAGDPCFRGGDPSQKGPDRIKGDVNHNCVLDAGDLIELFSDKVDDDANGYTDDIAGWDFFANDNDPYDDARGGHGTDQARWSSAEGNNGVGSIGACPDCRFVPLRVGDGATVEANDLAKALVYAADGGAKVIQAGVVCVDWTAFARAAVDYAYAHDALVVAAEGDQASRHHEWPATYNHVLPVHAITSDGEVTAAGTAVSTSSSSFLWFDACSNFGGQTALSVGASGCAGEAAGRAAGVAGLLFSESLVKGLKLSAEEANQLLRATADGVDVPESRSIDPRVSAPFYESKTGFSQRFGYGRPNVARAMAAIDRGAVPPEVDFVTPRWFDVLYADRTAAPIPVVGRVSAKRAQSYDYRVDWAAGVEPDDSAFQPLVDWVRNVPATMTTGGVDAPLAMLAPAQIDTTHATDPDSKLGENDRTVTLRVVALAHYAFGDVRGEARRAVTIMNQGNGVDASLMTGFPIALGASAEASPKLADVNGDGVRDVVVAASDGALHVYSLQSGGPAELPGFPYRTSVIDGLNANLTAEPSVPSYLGAPAYANGNKGGGIDATLAREAIFASPAVGDVNGDTKPEIVVSTWSGTVYVVRADGTALPGWPKRLPLVPSCPLDPAQPMLAGCADRSHHWSRGAAASPVLADFDHDGRLEIVQAAFDGNVYVWRADGNALPGWPVQLHASGAAAYARVVATPAVADFNGDGVIDVLAGSNEISGPSGGGFAFLLDGHGAAAPGRSPYLPDWPIAVPSVRLGDVLGEGIVGSPAVGAFERSARANAVLQGNGAPPTVLAADPKQPIVGFDPAGVFGDVSRASGPDSMVPLLGHPSVGDVDQDGVADVVMAGGSDVLARLLVSGGAAKTPFQDLLGMWSGASGHMTRGSPIVIEDRPVFAGSAIADVSGDDYPEVLIGTGGYFVHAVDACGCEAKSWPKLTGGWVFGTPAVGDIDGDHSLEVVAGTREGSLLAWRTHGSDTGVVQWESFHHDNANTGDFRRPLEQGVVRRAAGPIDCATDCATPAAPAASKLEPGGCACRAGAGARDAGGEAGLAAAACCLAAALLRRRRR